jgi:hypothetical protein
LTAFIVCVAASQTLAFDISYRYALIEGKNLEVCRHMLGVYDRSFRKPWSVDTTAPRGEDKTEVFAETLYSRYPTSPEFDAIAWKAHPYKVSRNQHSALYAVFDIDNDGVKDLVLRVGFFTGSPGAWDSLWVFPPGAVDFSQFDTHADFLERIAPKRRARIGYPPHQRPFIYRGRTYLHGYVWTPRRQPGTNPDEPFAPPEHILINEYLGGPVDDGATQTLDRSMKLVCKYAMRQQP